MTPDDPDRFTATMGKAMRRNRVFVEWRRNARGPMAVAPWSPRARPGASVPMPIAWEELAQGAGPARFSPKDAAQRSADPWAGFDAARKRLPGTPG